jgi:hypothetical protein
VPANAPGHTVTEVPSTATFAPNISSISSVCRRVEWGSATVVGDAAVSPASNSADFTCAEATGGW